MLSPAMTSSSRPSRGTTGFTPTSAAPSSPPPAPPWTASCNASAPPAPTTSRMRPSRTRSYHTIGSSTDPPTGPSGGHDDPDAPETLTYRLNCDMCIVDEIKLQPFKAYFQYGHPIYSSKAVRFRMGHSKLPHGSDSFVTVEDENLMAIADENYVWTYTSPEFPMLQENVLQSFKLPRPVLCIGGIVKVELLGRVQKQEADDRYYICVCHAQVRGRSLSPVFMVDTSDPAGYSVLKYLPDAKILRAEDAMLDDGSESLEWHSLVARYRRMRHLAIMNVLLGPEEFMDEDDIIGGVLMDEDDLGGVLDEDPFV